MPAWIRRIVPPLAVIAIGMAQDSAVSRIGLAKPIARQIRTGEIHSYAVLLERDH
ncbi:MAG: hypothetical protein HYX27_14885 [Acidobacteria bacterium]|nr:hypothetical protein [Acidobacteriota bacterium]